MNLEFISCVDRLSNSNLVLPNTVKLELYGLYKQSTIGDCNLVSPAFYEFQAKAKFDAWSRLKGLGQLEAQKMYIDKANSLLTNDDQNIAENADDQQGWLPNSQMVKPPANKQLTVFDLAKQGLIEELLASKDLTSKDENGMNVLHWAADREQLLVIKQFINEFDIDEQDASGNTVLHYACMVENREICDYLVQNGAKLDMLNNDGLKCSDLFDFTQ